MAVNRMLSTGDDTTNCIVCFEKYTSDEGEHTPRILPCSHTLCQKCIHHMLRRDTLECPECRVVHAAERDVLSFPQNKYIFANITKGRVIPTAPPAPPVSEFDLCTEHERDLSLYCKGARCQKPVCAICLISEHRTHDVIDIRQYGLEEERAKNVISQMEELQGHLESNKEKVLSMKAELDDKFNNLVTTIEQKKKKQIRILTERYDQIVAEATEIMMMAEENLQVNEIVAFTDEKLAMIENLRENQEQLATAEADVKSTLKDVKRFGKTLNVQRSFKYKESGATVADIEKLCGHLVASETKTEPSKTVQRTVRISPVTHICLLDDSSVVVAGKESSTWKLQKFSVQLDAQLSDVTLNGGVAGMTQVTIDEHNCVALAYKGKDFIEFRKSEDLTLVYKNFCTGQFRATTMITVRPSIILYDDQSKDVGAMRWLDCSSDQPEAAKVMYTRQSWSTDMCLMKNVNQTQLLVTSNSLYGVRTYNVETSRMEWNLPRSIPGLKKDMNPNGITTDGRGNLFVCDINNGCVQRFSTDGSYLGTALPEEEEKGQGQPWKIRWCDDLSALFIVYMKENDWNIRSVFVEYD